MKGKKSLSILLSIAMIAGACLPGMGVRASEKPEGDQVVYYNFKEYDSTIINDASGNGKAGVIRNYDAGGFEVVDANIYGNEVKALSLPGGADGGYLELPVGILDGQESVTISTWVKLKTDTGYQRIWDFGNDTTSYLYLLSDGGNEGFKGYAAAITQGGWSNETGVSKGTNVEKNRWVLSTVVMNGIEMTLYENGEKIGSKDTGISVRDLGKTQKNYLGYGQFGDNPTNAQYAEFEIFDYAMSDEQVAAMYTVNDEGIVAGDKAALDLGGLSFVTADLSLPAKGENGSAVSWSSSDETVISREGKVTRPEAGKEDAQVTLTASVSYGSASDKKEFQAVVPAMLSDQVIVDKDLDAIELVDLDSVVSNLELPAVGENGAAITWASSNEAVLTPEGRVTRPEVGQEDARVTLTATASCGKASKDRVFDVTVLAKEEAVTITGYEPMAVTAAVGHVPSLPGFVKVNYSDGTTGKVRTVWETPASDQYAQTGVFKAAGTILGTVQKIEAEVTVVEKMDSDIVLEAEGFDLNDITLDGDSILTQNRDRTLAYLKLLDNDRMLYNFRKTFGQDTKGASPLGGWDEPTGLLRGHSTGHYLSALSLAYASTKDGEIKDKLNEMIHELRGLQLLSKGDPAAFETKGTDQSVWNINPGEWGEGFLSAYSPDQFALLEVYTPYATIWAPYYTLHKIMAGLIDAYTYVGNQEALDAAKALGKWVYQRLSACSREQLTKMWDMYIAGELGGFNESMAKLYELTGDEDYLKGAKLFDNTKFFDNLSKNVDDIQGRHANQHIPQIVGAMELYQATVKAGKEETYYFDVAKNFWDMVVSRYAYSIGGVGTGENFKEPYKQAEYINTDRNCETCAAYNMLKLTRMLYQYDADNAEYMDYYERTLYNQIIASQNPNVTEDEHNGTTYMLPIGPGVRKSYGDDYRSFTCCHGTGMENHVKYQEAAYFKADNTLYVNLYLPSSLTWEEKGVEVIQETAFPSETAKLTVAALNGAGQTAFDMKLRVPYWAENGYTVTVNGKTAVETTDISTYVTLENIKAGDEIEITAPYGYHLDKTPDKLSGATAASLMYGPFVMVAKLDSTKWKTLVLSDNLSRSIKKAEGEDVLTLTTNGLTFKPMYDAADYAYHTYFKVMLGDGDSIYYEASVTNGTPDRGTFELSSEMVKEGEDLVITARPEEGYRVKRLSVNGKLVSVGEDNTVIIKNVREDVQVTGSFGMINPPKPDPAATEQTATVSAHFTAEWEKLEGIKNQNFNPTISNGGIGKGWGNWPQSAGSMCWVEYEWDAPVPIDGSKIFWYDDGGDTRVPSEVSFQYEDENGNMQDAVITSNAQEAKELDVYNEFSFEAFETTRLRINMKIASGAAATGIYRWIVIGADTEEPIPPADTSELKQILAEAEGMEAGVYTEESYANLSKAIEEAKALLSKENLKQQEVEHAVTALGNAKRALVSISGLSALVSECGKEKQSSYTASSWAAFTKALSGAKAVLAKGSASSQEISNAEVFLRTAKAKLVKVILTATKKLTIGYKEKVKLGASGSVFQVQNGSGRVTVTAGGTIRGTKVGKAKVTAVNEKGQLRVWNIIVKKAPAKIVKLNKTKLKLKKGKTFRIKATLPKNTASSKFTYKTTKKKVASVSSAGVIKAKKKGTCKIWVKTFNGKKKSIQVTVR